MNRVSFTWAILVATFAVLLWAVPEVAAQEKRVESEIEKDLAKIGRDLILNKRYLPQDFSQSTFEELWKDWPAELREQARQASPEERRAMSFARYGFTPRDDDPEQPLQLVQDEAGYYALNCFTCHAGAAAGTAYEGLPNSQINLQTMYEDLRRTKTRLKIPFGEMDAGSIAVSMGGSRGTTNAVVFGIVLMSYRDKDLNVKLFSIPRPSVVSHDMDAPPWWNVGKRDRLYIDGFVEKNHRALIPFVMDRRNRGRKLRGWESEFESIFAYIENLQPPMYPFAIDQELAEQGREVFTNHCAECHGTYGDEPTYPAKIVELAEIGTDPVRLHALTEHDRQVYHESWYAHYGADDTVIAPKGYQAPPLDGVWASAPYFHNGSVATVREVILPAERATNWKRIPNEFDTQRVGLNVEHLDSIPAAARRKDLYREYFDTRKKGKSAAGHEFGDLLDEEQVLQLLEYLKTL